MNIDSLRRYCLSLPHATEHVQWGDNLVFKIGGKMFVLANIDGDAPLKFSFKTDPETMAQLLEQPGIVPAPYLARAHWVALEEFDAIPDHELRQHVATAHRLVFESLPKKTRAALTGADAERDAQPPSRPGKSRPQAARRRSQAGRP